MKVYLKVNLEMEDFDFEYVIGSNIFLKTFICYIILLYISNVH